MAIINRSDVIQKAVNDLALSSSGDKIPVETLDKVQLTYSLNRQFSSFIIGTTRSSSGTMTLSLPVISDRQEIYITSIDFDYIKDAACDLATGSIQLNATPADSGVATNLLCSNGITLTAGQQHLHADYAYPLKLKPNTTMGVTGTFTAGVYLRAVNVTGFITSSN